MIWALQIMTLTFKKKSYFSGVKDSGIKICFIGPQLSHLLDTTFTSLEQNWCFIGPQLSHLWITTATSLRQNFSKLNTLDSSLVLVINELELKALAILAKFPLESLNYFSVRNNNCLQSWPGLCWEETKQQE